MVGLDQEKGFADAETWSKQLATDSYLRTSGSPLSHVLYEDTQ